ANGFSIAIADLSGVLQPGGYTLSVVGNGHVSLVAPARGNGNGAGGGAGGPQPNMLFRITAPPNPCSADFHNDGAINPDDLSDFITCFFLQVQFPGDCSHADFNSDGFVNPDDLSDFITTFFLAVGQEC